MANIKYTINLIKKQNQDGSFVYLPDIDESEIGEGCEIRHFNLHNLTCKISIDDSKTIRSSRKDVIDDAVWNDITTIDVGA